MFRTDIDINIINVHRSNDARKLLVNVKIYDNLITFINVYAPNNENARIAFFNRLKSFTTKHSCESSKMILCGDFNCNFDKKNDKSNKRLFETINNLDFVDLWHHKYPQENGFTLCDANNCPKSRIDYIFINKDLIDSTKPNIE